MEQEEIKKLAEDTMKNGDPVTFIIKQHQILHVGDKEIAKVLLLSIASQSILNSKGIQPKLSGESGKGKTHCCDAMMHLMPEEWIRKTTLSNKAIYRMNIKPGTVIYSDDVNLSDDLEDTIKRATTDFQKETYYNTLDINNESDPKSIPERLVWWLTSVDNKQSQQLLNRQFILNVDESPEQNKKVFERQVEQAITGKTGFEETEGVAVCREIISDLKKQARIVKIPFANRIDWPDSENRRNFDMFLDIIKGFAMLRHHQRDGRENEPLLADIEDFESAAELYNSMAEEQQLKTTKGERRLLDAIVELGGRATVDDLCAKLGLSDGRISQILNGKGNDSGLLNKVKELRREYIDRKSELIFEGFENENNFKVSLKDE
jgi:hypothetical protein